MSRQSWEQLLTDTPPWTTGGGSAVANTNIIVTASPSSPDLVLPPNYLYTGSMLKVAAKGTISTTGTPTIKLDVMYGGVGGVSLASTGVLTCGSGLSNLSWDLDVLLQIAAAGPSGSSLGMGKVLGLLSASSVSMIPASSPGFATLDTTAAKALTLCATWGTASPSNSLLCKLFTVESLN